MKANMVIPRLAGRYHLFSNWPFLIFNNRWAGLLLPATLLLLGLSACAAMPVREGPTAALLPGIETPRDRSHIDITIHEVPITAWGRCLQIVGKTDPMLAAMSVLTLAPLHGCARVARDRDLAAGQKPWCIIAVPKGNVEILEHELRHCEGWDHPRQLHDSKSDKLASRQP